MTLAAATYFEHLKAYVNGDYVTDEGASGKVVLTEKYFRPEDVKPQVRKIELLLPGAGIAFKLDHDDFDTGKGKNKPALFHFLDDNAKPWSKRCDFVVFYVNGRAFCADCYRVQIEEPERRQNRAAAQGRYVLGRESEAHH